MGYGMSLVFLAKTERQSSALGHTLSFLFASHCSPKFKTGRSSIMGEGNVLFARFVSGPILTPPRLSLPPRPHYGPRGRLCAANVLAFDKRSAFLVFTNIVSLHLICLSSVLFLPQSLSRLWCSRFCFLMLLVRLCYHFHLTVSRSLTWWPSEPETTFSLERRHVIRNLKTILLMVWWFQRKLRNIILVRFQALA